MGFLQGSWFDVFQHEGRIKGVGHGDLLTMGFWAEAQTDNRRLPVPYSCYGALQHIHNHT